MKGLLILTNGILAFALAERAAEVPSRQARQTESTVTETGGSHMAQQGQPTPGDSKANVTLMGCLDKEDKGNVFILVNKGDHRVEVRSGEDLSAHVGHQVKLEGTWRQADKGKGGTEGGTKGRYFDAKKIEDTSSGCVRQ